MCVNPEVAARQEHTAECRRRLEKELGMTERAKRAKKKVGEYVEKKMEEDEEVRRKRKSSEGETKEEQTNQRKVRRGNDHPEEERAGAKEAEKRKRNDEEESGGGETSRARGSNEEVLRSEAGKGGGSKKRAAEDEDDEEKTAKYLKKLAREAKRKERDWNEDREGVDVVVVAGQVVNEEVAAETAGWERWTEDGEDELDEEQVKVGRKEEKDFMMEKLKMFEFGSHE